MARPQGPPTVTFSENLRETMTVQSLGDTCTYARGQQRPGVHFRLRVVSGVEGSEDLHVYVLRLVWVS